MPGTQGSTSLTGQHELTHDFQEEQSCQRNVFLKQCFSSGREVVLLPLISLTSHVQGLPASKCQRDVLGDKHKHNCDVRKLETCLENQTSHCSGLCNAARSPALLLPNNLSPRNEAGTTCSTPALSTFTAKADQENCPKYKEAQSCSFTVLIIPGPLRKTAQENEVQRRRKNFKEIPGEEQTSATLYSTIPPQSHHPAHFYG